MGTQAWSLEEEAPRPWCPAATGGLTAFLPRAHVLGEQVLTEPSVMVPVDTGFSQPLKKEGRRLTSGDCCKLCQFILCLWCPGVAGVDTAWDQASFFLFRGRCSWQKGGSGEEKGCLETWQSQFCKILG